MTTETLRLSVAMCTYNGTRHLHEQLQSIADQARTPDEMEVCDDGSEDNTVGLLRAFARTAPFPVRVSVNAARLGWTKNFERAISRCRGDVIVLADQDDVWNRTKLARVERTFAGAPKVGAAISDADLVDDELCPLGSRLWQALRFSRSEQRRAADGRLLEVLLKRNVAAGATLAFRSRFKDLVLPIPNAWREDAHDAWIALLVAAVADVAIIAEPLVRYRQHARQQIGGQARGVAHASARRLAAMWADFAAYSAHGQTNCAAALTRFSLAHDRLLARASLPQQSPALAGLHAKIAHFRVRTELPARRCARLPTITRELLARRYHRYSRGWLSVAQDLVR